MQCYKPWYSEKNRMLLPCGKCAFCIKKRINMWALRLQHELEDSSSAFFLTLTYAPEHLPEDGQLSKRDLQLFIKRLRKVNPGIRYYAVGEYGTEGNRPHYHAVIFNLETLSLVTDNWNKGFVKGNRATMGRIKYMISYMGLPQDVNHRVPPFALMSRRPGIGHCYVVKNKHFHRARSDDVIYVFNTPNAMPRYYRDKMITNRYQKRLIQVNKLQYTKDKNLPRPTQMEHDRLMKKLNRKNK